MPDVLWAYAKTNTYNIIIYRRAIFKCQLWDKSWFPEERWHLAEAHQKDQAELQPLLSLIQKEECKLGPAKKGPIPINGDVSKQLF